MTKEAVEILVFLNSQIEILDFFYYFTPPVPSIGKEKKVTLTTKHQVRGRAEWGGGHNFISG